MADGISPAKRSQMMSGIKGGNSLPERLVRKALFEMGHRFRLHRRDLPGTPDITMPGRKIAIFVHGCFWHAHQGCKYARTPSTRTEFWAAKLQGNVDRDRLAADKLAVMGWRVLNVWECSTRDPAAAEGLPDAFRPGSTAVRPRARSAPIPWRQPGGSELGPAHHNAPSASAPEPTIRPGNW